jgi:hypothetical protein
MISAKKANWISHGSTAFSTLFYVFCVFCIVDVILSLQVSKLDRQGREHGMPTTIAPKNLEGAPEMFRLSLRVESRDFPTEEMTKMKAWSELQNTVTAYAQRLELMDSQESKRSLVTVGLYLLSAIGVFVFSILDRRNGRQEADGKVKSGTTPTDSG